MRPSKNLLCVALSVAFAATAKKITAAPGLFGVLDDAGASQFASLVRESPDLLDLLVAGEIATVFATSNGDNPSHPLKPRHSIIARERRETNTSSSKSVLYQAAFTQLEDMDSGSAKAKLKRKTANAIHASGGLLPPSFVIETAEHANLNGSGQNIVVQSWQPSSVSTSDDDYPPIIAQVYSGLGNTVNIIHEDLEFARCNDTGRIYIADDYFTLPESLCSTSAKLKLTIFNSFVQCSGLSETLNTRPSITVFIPANMAYENAGVGKPDHDDPKVVAEKVKALVIPNFLGYTPNLADGQTLTSMNGTDVKIEINGEGTFVNGGMVIQRDIILENGVAHVIEEVC